MSSRKLVEMMKCRAFTSLFGRIGSVCRPVCTLLSQPSSHVQALHDSTHGPWRGEACTVEIFWQFSADDGDSDALLYELDSSGQTED